MGKSQFDAFHGCPRARRSWLDVDCADLARMLYQESTEFEEIGPMKLKPLGDRIVVEREEAKEKTAGGIVLPDTAKDKPQKGKVLAVGDGRVTKDGKRRELQVKVGEQVLFTSYAGEEFKIDGDKKVLLMREEDILAVIG
jgi:chaperonin GroES